MALVVKRKDHKEKFDERKVYASVYAACASNHYPEQECEKTSESLCKTLKRFMKGKKTINSSDIRKKIHTELKKKDKELAFYYEKHLPNLKKL